MVCLSGGSALRTFFENATRVSEDACLYTALDAEGPRDSALPSSFLAEIVVYDSLDSAPRMFVLQSPSAGSLIDELSNSTHRLIGEQGGSLPYVIIREIMENLIHANFRNIVVSILESGRVLRVADQGPGISNRNSALLPGFTTASSEMKRFIRGVGSGLPLVAEVLSRSGGCLSIEDNLGAGTVLTIEAHPPTGVGKGPVDEPISNLSTVGSEDADSDLTPRCKKILALAFECGEVGPTLLSKELSIGLSTAFRDLEHLTSIDLIEQTNSGRRKLTPKGTTCVKQLFSE